MDPRRFCASGYRGDRSSDGSPCFEITGLPNLCLAGGVVFNCVANGKLLREKSLSESWVQPAAGDVVWGTRLGFILASPIAGGTSRADPVDSMAGSLLGPKHSNDSIRTFLIRVPAHHYFEKEEELLDKVAGVISNEQVGSMGE